MKKKSRAREIIIIIKTSEKKPTKIDHSKLVGFILAVTPAVINFIKWLKE